MADYQGPDPLAPDPLISAVVEMRPDAAEGSGLAVDNPGGVVAQAAAMLEGAPVDGGAAQGSGAPGPEQESGVAKAKGYFSKAGFEVHAPLGSTFSIAARQSQFEEFFGQRLLVDDEHFFSPVTTAEGADQLTLDPLPDDIRSLVRAVSFPPPPELPTGLV